MRASVQETPLVGLLYYELFTCVLGTTEHRLYLAYSRHRLFKTLDFHLVRSRIQLILGQLDKVFNDRLRSERLLPSLKIFLQKLLQFVSLPDKSGNQSSLYSYYYQGVFFAEANLLAHCLLVQSQFTNSLAKLT